MSFAARADNTIANWQLILIRFGEMLLFGF
jgi:hypothetical protein